MAILVLSKHVTNSDFGTIKVIGYNIEYGLLSNTVLSQTELTVPTGCTEKTKFRSDRLVGLTIMGGRLTLRPMATSCLHWAGLSNNQIILGPTVFPSLHI